MPCVSIVPEGRLAVGMQLPVQALSTRTSQPWEREGDVDDLVATAQACDRAGFCYVAVCDHVAIPRSHAEAMSTTWFDPVSTLAFVAASTSRVRLMTNVYVVAYRHPLQTAKSFATLDHLSGGRVILGVGAGHVEGEFEALGVPFATRGARTDEAIDGIVAAWTEEYPVLAGPAFAASGVGLRPRPRQHPRPPIWIGGSGRPALRRVAARGDGWIPQGTPRSEMPEAIAYILHHRDAVRPGAVPEIGYITEYLHVGRTDRDLPRHTVHGGPEEIAASLNELGAMGVAHLQVRFAVRSRSELCDQVEAFGASVLPLLERTPLS